MKRRNFLQWCLGALGISTVGVPTIKAATKKTATPLFEILDQPPTKIRWRKWAKLDKCPEAYTQEDIKIAQEARERLEKTLQQKDLEQQIKALVSRQQQTLDQLCKDVITGDIKKTRKFRTKAKIDKICGDTSMVEGSRNVTPAVDR